LRTSCSGVIRKSSITGKAEEASRARKRQGEIFRGHSNIPRREGPFRSVKIVRAGLEAKARERSGLLTYEPRSSAPFGNSTRRGMHGLELEGIRILAREWASPCLWLYQEDPQIASGFEEEAVAIPQSNECKMAVGKGMELEMERVERRKRG
jgi:hypothetical protein